jgi:hypothetical protein
VDHDALVSALRGILAREGVEAPRPPLKPGDARQCESCGLRYIVTPDGLCPNNNCPQHYHSYPAYRAATGRIIAELEAGYFPPVEDSIPGTPAA